MASCPKPRKITEIEPQSELYFQTLDTLDSMLSNNENYFISWNGQRSTAALTDPLKLEEVVDNLYEMVETPDSSADFETCTPSVLLLHQKITAMFIQAFLFILDGKHFRAAGYTTFLGKWFSEYCIMQKYFDPEYLDGIKYLSRWLKLHITVARKDVSMGLERIKDLKKYEYETLCDKSKAIVLAVKCYFLTSMKTIDSTAKTEANDCLRMIAKLDPETFTWHYQLGNWLRCTRRTTETGTQSVPSQEEMYHFWKAYTCSLELQKIEDDGAESCFNMTLAALCQCLAEIVRWKSYARSSMDNEIKMGGLEFRNNYEAVQFIMKNVTSINEKTKSSFPELIRAGEIVFNILPMEFRNLDLAERLLKRAWLIIKTNSKVNHKLGLLYLARNYVDQALEFLRDAVKYTPTNVPALMDLIKTLMHSPEVNSEEIKTLINSGRNIPSVNSKRYQAQFYCIEGFFTFMLGDRQNAVQMLLRGQKLDPSWNLIADVMTCSRRYKWSKSLFNLEDMKKSLETYLKSPNLLEEDRHVLQNISRSIRNPASDSHTQGVYRPRYGARSERLESESDRNTNWRQPLTTNSPEKSKSISHNPRNEFRVDRTSGFRKDRYNQQRSSSPLSWR